MERPAREDIGAVRVESGVGIAKRAADTDRVKSPMGRTLRMCPWRAPKGATRAISVTDTPVLTGILLLVSLS